MVFLINTVFYITGGQERRGWPGKTFPPGTSVFASKESFSLSLISNINSQHLVLIIPPK